MVQMGTKKLINVHKFSECLTEHNIAYPGNDINNGASNLQSDGESCRASCAPLGARYFTWTQGTRQCWCKHSKAGRVDVSGERVTVSGEICSGEKHFPNHHFCLTFCSTMHTLKQ